MAYDHINDLQEADDDDSLYNCNNMGASNVMRRKPFFSTMKPLNTNVIPKMLATDQNYFKLTENKNNRVQGLVGEIPTDQPFKDSF